MERPKKPASGFLRFLSEQFKSFDPSKNKYREFQKQIAQDWNSLTDEKKQVYNEASRQESVLYRQELAKWEMKMIRLGHTDLVRNDTLIDTIDKPKTRKASKKAKPESSDSD